jgi:hypothetical protein
MTTNDPISCSLFIVDQTLRETFPDSYWKRCTYAAFGLRMLLKEVGIIADIVFGDLLCFTLSTDTKRPLMEGYGNGKDGVPSHFWVEAADSLLDLGPYYLPREARRPIVSMPLIRWSLDTPLPLYLRYREVGRGHLEMEPEASIAPRVANFLEHCLTRSQSTKRAVTMPTWELKHAVSVHSAAQRGDMWARGALRFSSWANPATIPF